MIDPVSTLLQRNAGGRGPLVLMYHSVSAEPGTPGWRWAVSRRRFREQLDFLQAEGWSTPCLRDLNETHRRALVISFDDGYADNYWAFEELARRGMRATWFIVTRDIGNQSRWTDPGVPARPMLDATQLREMHAGGMEIGGHSHSHVRLTTLADVALEEEIAAPRRILEDLLDSEVASFAYPYGDHDQRTVDAVQQAGYRHACITRPGWVASDRDPYRIRRVSVFAGDTLGSFARTLAFADNEVGWSRMIRYTGARVLDRLGGGRHP